MSTIFEPAYGGPNADAEIPLTMTSLNGLANGAYAASAYVDNAAKNYEDAMVGVTIATGATGATSTGAVQLYVYADVDATPHYSDNMPGTDSLVTPTNPVNLKPLGQPINCVANSSTYRGGRYSVARAFGGWMPKRWGVVALNSVGGALAASGHSVSFYGINGQGV